MISKSAKYCDKTFGRNLFVEGRPAATHYDHAIVQHDSLYNPAGLLIEHSTYSTGTYRDGRFAYDVYAPRLIDFETLPESGYENCFWLGFFHDHFGHFLVSTLQRLWYLKETKSSFDYIVSSHYDPSYLNKPFIREILGYLNIRSENIIMAPEQTMIRNIVVPEPAFVENSHCYAAWRDFMQDICRHMLPGTGQPLSGAPIFFSRSQAKNTTRSYRHEAVLEEKLASLGMKICHPETLSFQEQLEIWSTHSVFVGFSGSAFINAAFFKEKTLIILNHDDFIFGTQRLIDQSSRNKARYLNVSAYLTTRGEAKDQYCITDPAALASLVVLELRKALYGR